MCRMTDIRSLLILDHCGVYISLACHLHRMQCLNIYTSPCKSISTIENFRYVLIENRKNNLILIMTPEKQDKTLESSKHWSVDSTPARNEVIMKRTYPVKSVKCDKICSNY